MNLRLKAVRWPFSFEKWYIDCLMDDGAVLLVYLGRLHLLGARLGQVTADLFRPGQPPLRGSATVRGFHGGDDFLRCGAAMVLGERLSFQTAQLSGELRFRARHRPAALGVPFLTHGSHRLDWTVEIPDAEVQGELRWPGGGRSVTGRGYRDRAWTDMPPWRWPLTELTWGRAAAGDQAATWVEARTPAKRVRCRWLNGAVVQNGSWPVELSNSRVLLDTAIYDLDSLHLGPLRPVLRHFYGDPWQTKWAATSAIAADRGVAIHEAVRWH